MTTIRRWVQGACMCTTVDVCITVHGHICEGAIDSTSVSRHSSKTSICVRFDQEAKARFKNQIQSVTEWVLPTPE
eukprot:9336912-Pyramimonas_sp.AAC.1